MQDRRRLAFPAGVRSLAAALVEGAAELVAPTRCAGCDLPGVILCDRCRRSLPLIEPGEACPRCGAPGGLRWCGECWESDFAFSTVRCAGAFEPPLSRCITLYKDAGELRLAPLLAELAADATAGWLDGIDAVVPVPPSPAALARRGFDHTARLACDVARLTGLPAVEALVGRPRRDQRSLSRGQRLANAAGSLRVVRGASPPPRVLVVDDVFTTGATVDAAARALLAAGVAEVRALTVGRAVG